MKSTERAYPLRVIRVVLTERRALPVYPDKRTSSESVGMSQRCHKPTPIKSTRPRSAISAELGRPNSLGEEGDAFGSVGALIARPPNPPSASEAIALASVAT